MRRIFYIVVALNSLIAAFIVRTPYRQLIIDKVLEPSVLADFSSSFFFTLALPFVVFSIFSPATVSFGLILVTICTLLSIIFELIQAFNGMTFDLLDIYAILAGGILAAIGYLYSRRLNFA